MSATNVCDLAHITSIVNPFHSRLECGPLVKVSVENSNPAKVQPLEGRQVRLQAGEGKLSVCKFCFEPRQLFSFGGKLLPFR